MGAIISNKATRKSRGYDFITYKDIESTKYATQATISEEMRSTSAKEIIFKDKGEIH